METTLIWGLYALWFATISSSCMVIGYVWRIRHERINEALNTGRLQVVPENDPFGWPTGYTGQ
jgi:hypothetical protein